MMMANVEKLAPAYCSGYSISTMAKDDDRSSVSSHSGSTSGKSDDVKKAPGLAAPAPRKVLSMELGQINWQDLQGSREWRTVLRLRGLPACLCQPGMLEAYLQNCGLNHLVDKVKTAQTASGQGKKLGCAMIRAVSTDAVKELAKFFHGRQVGNSLIAVSFAPSQGLAKQDSPKKIEKPEMPLGEPVRIETTAPKRANAPKEIPRCPPGAWHMASGAIKGLVDLPPGLEHLCPPPGLEHLNRLAPPMRKQLLLSEHTTLAPAHVRVQ